VIPSTYDALIKSAVLRFMPPGFDWLRCKAQFYQESQLDPKAVSPVGAKGIGQLMPDTQAELWKELSFPAAADVFDPYYNILASVRYDAKMWAEWKNPNRRYADRWCLMLASYNAGIGNMVEAQKAADGALDYASIIHALPEITGNANAAQTRTYVEKIEGYYAQLVRS
jgi:soluble lytic murein transglycosylase-like protein